MKYHLKENWILNPNVKIQKSIIKAVERNDGYCPCNQGSTPKEDTKCPCVGFREHNKCCCNLYVKIK